LLKFFRINHCDEEIREQSQRNQADDEGFHICPLELFAPMGVELRGREERRHDRNEN
jgi:hypothetical protein